MKRTQPMIMYRDARDVRRAPGHRQRLEGCRVQRVAHLTREAVLDEDARIVRLSFSSELQVERGGFWEEPWLETLGHDDAEVVLDRLNDGAALLYNHQRTRADRLGRVLRAWVEDGRGYAEVQFSGREDVADVWEDVRNGILTTVSVGYMIHERELTHSEKDKPDEYRVTRWEPFELSFVDVPADATVGVGRSHGDHGGDPAPTQYRVVDLDNDESEEEIPMNLRALLAALAAAMGRDALVQDLAQRSNLEADAVRDAVSAIESEDAPTTPVEVRSAIVDLAAAKLGDAATNPTGDRSQPDAGLAVDLEAARQRGIRDAFEPYRERVQDAQRFGAELNRCLNDRSVSVDAARSALLTLVGSQIEPAGGERIQTGTDGRDRFQADAQRSIMDRCGMALPENLQGQGSTDALRGMTLVEIARRCLEMAGDRAEGTDRMEMLARAFSSSDFPLIVENIANHAMLNGFQEAPETWDRWCEVGPLSDFKLSRMVNLSTFNDLELVAEGGEYRYGTLDEEGEPITLGTYGKLFEITRQAIINDDLGAFTRIPQRMGRAAARVPGDLAYAILTANGNLSDGVALFHTATHGNLASSGAAPSVATISAARVAMATQTDQQGNTVPHPLGFLLVPEALYDATKVVVAAEHDTDTAADRTPNPIRNIGEVISDYRLDADSAAAWYAAARKGFDTVMVGFLDGQRAPTLESRNGWSRDGVEYKVRIDAAAAAMGHRGLYKNPGV